ncbi:DUF3168 domain-containing protein [Sulfitobacter sp.]|uniref:DUF3168 domain-containing protein n=1 Tax=Sulfitobacter sp. TaxID=1903071 RepID=UPI003F6C09A4
MEEDFRALLTGAATVTAICGTRIEYGGNAQGAAYPRIALYVIGDNESHTMRGPDGLSVGRVQVDCYAMTYGGAKLLGRAVRAVLDGYSGGDFQGVFHAGTRDTREGGSNEATRPYKTSLDFITNFAQS